MINNVYFKNNNEQKSLFENINTNGQKHSLSIKYGFNAQPTNEAI